MEVTPDLSGADAPVNSSLEAPSEVYFAAKPIDELVADLQDRVEEFYSFIQSSGVFERVRKSYQAYYGLSEKGFSAHGLGQAGEEGELSTVKINHYRSIVMALVNMTCSQKASYEVRATNTDYKSQTQTILADGILDYYLREKHLERSLRDGLELSLVGAESYVMATWEPTGGEQYGVNPDTGAVIYEGDIDYSVLSVLDVIKDITAQNSKQSPWKITRKFKNRFDLAAKHQDKAEDILAVKCDSKADGQRLALSNFLVQSESDLIPYYEFFHARTDACPNGRYVIFLNSDTWLFDGPLPYRRVPVHRICPSELHGTPFGYSPMYDLLAPQEVLDILFSTIVSNQASFGVQNIWTKPGSGLTLSQLRSGLNHWESEEPPEAIQLCKTAPETFQFIPMVVQTMETLSGANSTIRGNPSTDLKSGAALAMVASQAVQFNSGLQQAWAALFEDVGTATFEILQDFAKVPRVAAIVGEHDRSFLKEFSSNDINHISRVVFDVGNPVARTTAGRIEMANNLLQAEKFDTPEQYLQVIATGKLDPLVENKRTQMLNIRAENERLRAGGEKPVVVIISDDHRLHCVEHMAVLDDPESRLEPDVVNRVLAHVQEHMAQWRSADPSILMLRGLQPLPPPPMPGLPAGSVPPGGPGAAMPPPAGQGGVNPAPLDATNPVVAEANGVKGPRMPNLPKGAPEQTQAAYAQVKAGGQ